MKRFLPALSLIFTATTLAFAQAASPEQTFRAILDSWAVALVQADVDAFTPHASPDWTLADANGNLIPKTAADADLRSGKYKVTSYKYDEIQVRVIGDTAIVSGIVTQTSAYAGQDTSGRNRFTDVFVRQNGVWQAQACHLSRLARP